MENNHEDLEFIIPFIQLVLLGLNLYLAHLKNRKKWIWFFLSLLIPFNSTLILLFAKKE